MNRDERVEWVQNNEGLYRWWKSTRMSIYKFVVEYRTEIDKAIVEAGGRL